MRPAFGFLLVVPTFVACSSGSSSLLGDDAGADVALSRDTGGHEPDADAAPPRDAARDTSVDARPDVGIATGDAQAAPDARDAAGPPPAGATLAPGSHFLVEGVTDDGHVIYATPTSIKAVPVAGGVPVVLAALGFNEAGAFGNGAVLVVHDFVFIWTDVTQLDSSANPVGTLSIWPTSAASPTVVSKTAIAPTAGSAVLPVAASPDGASFVYMTANSSSGVIASIVGANAAAPLAGVVLDSSIGAPPNEYNQGGLCTPSLTFSGAFVFAHYCDVVAGDELPPTLAAFRTAGWTKETLLDGAVVSAVDGTGAYAAGVNLAGQLETLSTSSDAGTPVAVDPAVTMTTNQSILVGATDQFVLYTTPAAALKVSPLGSSLPTTLVATNVASIDGVSPDATWVYVNAGTDPNTGLPADLSLASTSTPGTPRLLVNNTLAYILGDPFTSDSSYALFASQLQLSLTTGAFSGATLNAALVPGTSAPVIVSANAGYQMNGLTGTNVLYADNLNPTGGIAGVVDLHTKDLAGGASSLVIAGADVTYALTSDKSKLVYTLNFGENTDGLYVVPVQ